MSARELTPEEFRRTMECAIEQGWASTNPNPMTAEQAYAAKRKEQMKHYPSRQPAYRRSKLRNKL